MLALVLVAAVGVARAADAEADVEGGPTGRLPGPPFVDPHLVHREQEPKDKDVYALKLCCTEYHALDKWGQLYATCNQKYYWVCVSKERCQFRPPRRVPAIPFSKKTKCPGFSPRTHSNFAGPCLRECSRVQYSEELRGMGEGDDIDFGDDS